MDSCLQKFEGNLQKLEARPEADLPKYLIPSPGWRSDRKLSRQTSHLHRYDKIGICHANKTQTKFSILNTKTRFKFHH